MFGDSRIASEMQLSRTKTAYLASFGLAPYFHHKLIDDLRSAQHLVVCFGESFNRISKKQQMDLAVRFWDETKKEVSTRYFNSSFMGHSTASDLLQGFKGGLEDEINQQKITQVSIHGPNVNWAFLDLLKKKMLTCEEDPKLVDTGSYGLHVLHGAFQMAFRKTGWDIDTFLKSIHNVFKDSPARRADFVHITKSREFPMKFCNCRWLENVSSCETAIKILPHLKLFFTSTDVKLPDTYSVKKSTEILRDLLLLPKLNFFQTMACAFELFLKEFQTPKPMFPFLYSDLENLTREPLERFIKPSVLEEANTTFKMLHINTKDLDNTMKLRQVKIGPAVKHSLEEARVKEVDMDKFRLDAKNCLVQIVGKLIEKSPLKYKFVKAATCLDPKKIAAKAQKGKD